MNRSHHQKPAMLKTLLLLVVSLSCAVHSLAQTDTTTNDGPALNEETVAVTENSAEQEDSPDPTIAQDDVLLQLLGNNQAAKKAPEQFTMNMREADIRGFVQWIADRTQKNIIVHRSVRGTVTVISSRPVSPDEAYELFLTVLALNGFAAVDSEGTIMVVPDADAKTSDIPFAGNEARRGEIVTAIISLEHTEASEFVASLKPLIPASAYLSAYQKTNSLIVADTARSIEKIEKIIAILDRAESEIDLEIIPIVHASADDILSVIKSVATALEGGTAKENAKIDFAVDKRSNSILITGNKKRRTQIKKVIARLDRPLDGNSNTQVIYLNYIEAAEITGILQSVGDSMLKETKTEDIKSFSIESSEANNALVISAPPSLMENIKSIISQLDIQRAQVLIEAVLVQVSGDAGDDFGVVWGASEIYETNPNGAVAAINTGSAAANPGGLLSSGLASDDGLTSNELAAGLISNSGLSFGYLKDGNLIGALQAISTRNKSNILSTPTIVAMDNEEASLLVGQNVPFITGSSTSSGSSVVNPFQTVQRQDVGISLTVTPRINQGDSITLDIDQKTENVSENTAGGAVDLITDKAEIKTSVLIKDGQVLVLGGLIREDKITNRTQVPILGSIPYLGRLFSSYSDSKSKNNLMVFIRPTILKDQMQISGLTSQRYAFMREKQLQKAMSAFIKYSDRPLMQEFDTFSPRVLEEIEDAAE